MPDRVKWIEHKGEKILFIDYKDIKVEKIEDVLIKLKREYESQPKDSVLDMTDVTNANYDRKTWKKFNEYGKLAKPYLKASAVIGITKPLKIMLKAYQVLTGQKVKAFNSFEEASDWLVEQ
ncbi:MAG: hypothetical protein JRJ27_10250 [Deltaproteobacteria bacterium]|nr:hypothetical protein [Deltaproteobacteria bacterium]